MKDTKANRINFINEYIGFGAAKRPMSKSQIKARGDKFVNDIVGKYKELYAAYLKNNKYIVLANKEDETYEWKDYLAESEAEITATLLKEGYTNIVVATAEEHHFCKYCGSIASGKNKDLLCDDCCELFSHTCFSEL